MAVKSLLNIRIIWTERKKAIISQEPNIWATVGENVDTTRRLGLSEEGKCYEHQSELDHLFSSIVLPSITYGLPVYGASEAELTAMQCFLDRCYKRKYTSKSFSIKHLLEKQDRKVFSKVSGIDRHPLRGPLHKKKVST